MSICLLFDEMFFEECFARSSGDLRFFENFQRLRAGGESDCIPGRIDVRDLRVVMGRAEERTRGRGSPLYF